MLDISPQAIKLAQSAFQECQLEAEFEVGDCLNLPYSDNSFDVVFSIGLLEHFEDARPVLMEKLRVLKKNGLMFNYIVPNIPNNVQADYEWFNTILGSILPLAHELNKTDVYRSDALCDHYTKILEDLGLQDIKGTGIYPVPMISNSPEFPFTLLNEAAELNIVKHFERLLEIRGGTNPWLCDESFGQAILVTARK